MKKILLVSLAVAALGISSSALAQTAGPKGLAPVSQGKKEKLSRKEMEKINEEIMAKLDLTADQKAKLEAHKKESADKLKDLRKEGKGGDKAAAKEKMKAFRKENQTFMKTLLTKEQMRKMQMLRKEAIQEREKNEGTPKPQ